MYIHEAVKLSEETGKSIYRKEWGNTDKGCVITPTNDMDCCTVRLILDGKEVSRCRCWNPTADDLIADDWEMVTVEKNENESINTRSIKKSSNFEYIIAEYPVIDLVTVSFQLPRLGWKIFEASDLWYQVCLRLEEIQKEHIQK